MKLISFLRYWPEKVGSSEFLEIHLQFPQSQELLMLTLFKPLSQVSCLCSYHRFQGALPAESIW